MAFACSHFRYDASRDFARIDRERQDNRAILTKVSPANAVRLLPQLMRDLGGRLKTVYSLGDVEGLLDDYCDTCVAVML